MQSPIEKILTFLDKIKIKKSMFKSYYKEGLKFYEEKEYELAENLFRLALEQEDAKPYVYYNLGLTYHYLNREDDAIEAYKKLLKAYPSNSAGYYNIAIIYYKRKDYENALEYFYNSFKIKPDEENVKGLAKTYLHLEKLSEILELVDFIFKSNCDKNYAYIIAKVFETKEYLISDMTYVKHALNIYLKLLKINPNNFEVAMSASLAYSKLGDWKNAIKLCKIALKINPNSFDANNQMGLVYYCSGEMDKSIQYYEKAFELGDDSNEKIYSNLAYAYEKAGQVNDAIEIFNELLEKFPDLTNKSDILEHISQLNKKY